MKIEKLYDFVLSVFGLKTYWDFPLEHSAIQQRVKIMVTAAITEIPETTVIMAITEMPETTGIMAITEMPV